MASAYYYNQQQAGGVPSHMAQQHVAATRGMPGQIGLNPLQGQYMQQQQQQQQAQYRNQQSMVDNRKRGHSKVARQNLPVPEEIEEPSGDELDDISARDIAMARYKRNHDYLSEIFTPYNAESIVQPHIEITQTKEELEKQIEECNEEAEKRKKTFEDKLASIEQDQQKYWNLMSKLNEAQTLEDIESSAEEIAKELGVKVEHTDQITRVQSIPGIEEDQPAESTIAPQSSTEPFKSAETNNENITTSNSQIQGTNASNDSTSHQQQNTGTSSNDDTEADKDMVNNNNASVGKDEDTNMDDSFFNEMVNAEDDSAVNEFLNTE